MPAEVGEHEGAGLAVDPARLDDAVVEEAIPETTVIDADGEAFAFSAWRRGEGKQKGPPCVGCARNAQCEGPWREYPARFGWSELVPYAAGE